MKVKLKFEDSFSILQIALWLVIPLLLENGLIKLAMIVYFIIFIVQYIPKVYHAACVMRRMHNLNDYIFGTVWWGSALNLIGLFLVSHIVGAFWYVLGLERVIECLEDKCEDTNGCGRTTLTCKEPLYFGITNMVREQTRMTWAQNIDARSTCLEDGKSYTYGFYAWVVQLVTDENRLEKSLFSLFWGVMTLCTFGNLQTSPRWLEVIFNIIVLTCGLFLVTMLIGNIKVFLNTITSKPQTMKMRMRSIELWMKKKRLPKSIRERVRTFERQRWAATRGVDESELINDLPEGLRKDIKYHLCWDLVRQVPLFQHMDDQVLEHICDRVKSIAFTRGETISREGDPVQRMIFVVRGHLQSSQELHDGVKSYCMLGPGNFSGDELLSWCLRRPFVERLPPSSSTMITLETTEAFVLEAWDVKYVTQHFSYNFVKEKVMNSAKYYSPGWRTWAAVAIQLAWRRYKDRSTLTTSLSIRKPDKHMLTPSMGEDKLRFYAAMLNSQKPDNHSFDFEF
ncbi:putative potassium channel, voltage-dependent, EAG/ELK/ERG [Lupinus albus]|uniref:Putative potassium channel, voltage-dependent, EAG/ELK/ERG n=1 Tax=Lupinus albus TaxID=3870 RepID=A0A6A4N4A3_LUPAL|nr:putative potassium channel, voltage-dependent, EAG/ELK/ERG [Lupinus albus]